MSDVNLHERAAWNRYLAFEISGRELANSVEAAQTEGRDDE